MRIFADSASDLPKLFFETNQVELAPLRVHIDDKEYEDINDIVSTEVYAEIRNGKQPKTSQTSPEHFLRIFEDLAKSGEEGIYIAFSSELSGTYSTAVMMKEQLLETYPDMKLTIIDSKCASLGYGLLVKEAVKLRDEGLSLSEIEEKIRWNATHMEHLFTVDDLDYMARGGRVSKASAFIGGLLNIKPVLHVEEGKLVPIEKIRGTKKVMKRIVELVEERGGNLEGQVIAISHADVLDRAQELKEMILEKMQPTDVEIHLIGSTIGAHTGPGAISVFFLNKEA
ncbi:MAG: DegV family protein [Psychrobacillus sp.]|uniref:DegV family protein n=1 Tax=unclassified Psychrobacillus TaxID=2636677 RepID=UPI0020422B5F|nr:DegV family protein [Psychrobacillus sp. MER TA 171]MCM3358915.1 DegV family protein [Psychrobacillus sp. MER TA 171]